MIFLVEKLRKGIKMNAEKLRIEQLERELAARDHTILALQNSIEELTRQVTNLTEAIIQMRHDKYGSSSEKHLGVLPGQISFFNEVEIEAAPLVSDEPFTADSKGKAVKNGKRTRKDMIIDDIPVEEYLIELEDDDQNCDICSSRLKPIGKTFVRDEIRYIPSSLKIIRYMRMNYECPECKHTDRPVIIRPVAPPSLLNHSLASPSSVAYVMYQKYVQGIPLYRLEKEWERMGIILSRTTMANWVIRCHEEYLSPVLEHMRKLLLSRDIVHADETPVQVLKEDGKKPQSKSYMWVYRTGNDGMEPIIMYDYQPSRSGDNAAAYLKDFRGYVHSDGFSGYNKLTEVTRCGCWAHLRRKFAEAIPKGKASGINGSQAQIGIGYCDRLFKIEDELKDMSPEDRYIKRQELARPVLEAFWSWLETVNALPGSKLGKAVTYASNQKPYMENYLLDGRLSLSNNAAENAIRPFAVGRKNWLFADSPKGAFASAGVYSMIETAKANGLEPYRYLELLLHNMPDWDHTVEDLEDLLPWSDFMKERASR